jgi:adenine C2-methylase RlmN of 23S rRNA A2503 and tRNA A37
MNTLSKKVREILKENVFFNSMEIDSEVTSKNGQTTKILWKTKD